MRLELRTPADWTRRAFDQGEVVIVPGFALVPDLTLEVHPLRRRLDVSGDQILASRLPRGAQLVDRHAQALASETGWAMNLVEARAITATGAPIEIRLLCAYPCLGFVGIVLVHALDPARLAAQREAIVAVLRTARPRFRDTRPAELSELWDLGASE